MQGLKDILGLTYTQNTEHRTQMALHGMIFNTSKVQSLPLPSSFLPDFHHLFPFLNFCFKIALLFITHHLLSPFVYTLSHPPLPLPQPTASPERRQLNFSLMQTTNRPGAPAPATVTAHTPGELVEARTYCSFHDYTNVQPVRVCVCTCTWKISAYRYSLYHMIALSFTCNSYIVPSSLHSLSPPSLLPSSPLSVLPPSLSLSLSLLTSPT